MIVMLDDHRKLLTMEKNKNNQLTTIGHIHPIFRLKNTGALSQSMHNFCVPVLHLSGKLPLVMVCNRQEMYSLPNSHVLRIPINNGHQTKSGKCLCNLCLARNSSTSDSLATYSPRTHRLCSCDNSDGNLRAYTGKWKLFRATLTYPYLLFVLLWECTCRIAGPYTFLCLHIWMLQKR